MPAAVHLEEIPYHPDSGALFERIRDLPAAALLDSNFPRATGGRYDILVAQPAQAPLPLLPGNASEQQALGFFDELRRFHADYYGSIAPAGREIPFCGGILGAINYDTGNRLHGITSDAMPGTSAHSLRAYDWCLLQDHLSQRAVVATLPQLSPALRRDLLARVTQAPATAPAGPGFSLQRPFRASIDHDAYVAAFDAVQAYIHAGDCYQVNLAQHFSAPYSGDPWPAYRALREVAHAPFSAYLTLPDDGALLSLSPERFLSLQGRHVETSPIKGTRARHADPELDARAARELGASAKDRAENLMIVDLLRNDLGRSCLPGSINVHRLFELQSFSTVHHLVSSIGAELHPSRSAWELLRDSFPGGSITGAPKRRSMQIIDELEAVARGPYCGSVLYVSADGRMDSNIAIRTLLCDGANMHCWAGGGIVADSQAQAEYQETYDKVGRFLALLETHFKA